MSVLLIEFDPTLGFWSPFVYWFVTVNAILCGVFTLVVIVGGVYDLRFLFAALNEAEVDETDDGRVVAGGPGESGGSDT